MDVSFLVKTLQRRWWLIFVCALLGWFIVVIARDEGAVEYRSQATLLVRPPSAAAGGASFSDSDRYVQGQLRVLENQGMVEDVASRVTDLTGSATRPGTVRRSVEVTQVPDTDVVEVVALAGTAELAQTIAGAYTAAYLDLQRAAAATSQQQDLDRLEERLAAILTEIDGINAEFQRLLAPYVTEGAVVPEPRLIDPVNASRLELLLADYNRVGSAKEQLELAARQQVNTDVVQQATLPGSPAATETSIPVSVGVAGGALLGLFLVMVSAQFSPYALDEIAVGNAVAGTVTGRLHRRRELRHAPLTAYQLMPVARGRALDSLAVRAEARQGGESVLTVLVIGTHRGAGSTTVALALAGRLSQSHQSVMVVDADFREQRITELALGAPEDDGAAGAGIGGRPSRQISSSDGASFTEIPISETVAVLLRSDPEERSHPAGIVDLVAVAAEHAQVVIVDGGPVLESGRSVQLAREAQVVILVASERSQRLDELDSIRVEIGSTRSPVLVVSNDSGRAARSRRDHTRRAGKRARASAVSDASGQQVADQNA